MNKSSCITLVMLLSVINTSFSKTQLIRTANTGFYSIEVSTNNKRPLLKNAKQELPYFQQENKPKDDKIIFFSEMLHGAQTWQHGLDDFNGIILDDSKKAKKRNNKIFSNQFSKLPECKSISTIDHLEQNNLLIRVNTRQYIEAPELWYWKKITHITKNGFSVPLDFSKVDTQVNSAIKVTFRGINKDKNLTKLPTHVVNVLFNGKKVTTLDWQDKKQFQSSWLTLPKNQVLDKDNKITFQIPKRTENDKKILDVVMLDYIDFKFDIQKDKISSSYPITSSEKCHLMLKKSQFAFSSLDKKYYFKQVILDPNDKVYLGDDNSINAVSAFDVKPLNINKKETDYLIISHPLFIDSVKPLAQFYRQKGLVVDVVDINDVYNHYSYGVRELYSIKNIIKDIYKTGEKKLKYVLLVGDSSWDWRESKKYLDKYASWANKRQPLRRNFIGQMQYTYEDKIQNRDFVPTGQYHSSQGHSASDNWFVAVQDETKMRGEDYLPDVAIGRFTAATVEEADAMVSKSINYQKNSKVGPWKSRVLWITNADKRYQRYSKNLGNNLGKLGVVAENVFPPEMDGDNFKVQETLTNAINDGDLIVHFVGHGGNSIWRIGPPDLKRNRDLFTIKQVDNLTNKDKLPFVMSMSCYSAPYDHPIADSIGEKFFRAKDKGAIAVLAASWRNSPSQAFSKKVIDNIYKMPRQSLGAAIMNAKREYKGRVSVEMYNLLGDPALFLALPALEMNAEVNTQKRAAVMKIDAKQFIGQVKMETVNDKDEVISEKTIKINSPSFTVSYENCKQVRLYAWDEKQNIDAMSSFSCQETKP